MYAHINRWGFYSLTITIYILIHCKVNFDAQGRSVRRSGGCYPPAFTVTWPLRQWRSLGLGSSLCFVLSIVLGFCNSYYYLPSAAFTGATSLWARQMIDHIHVCTPSQYRLNQCCSWNISSLTSFPISCVNIPTVDGSNTDFACSWGRDETSVEVKPTWTLYLMFNCVIYKETSLVTHTAVRPKVNWLFRLVRSPGADWLFVRRQLMFFNHFCQL